MSNFVEFPHGYVVNADEILYYQVLAGADEADFDVDYDEGFQPTKLIIRFKNGEDLEIPDFEKYHLKDLWNSLQRKPKEQPDL